MVRDLYLLPLNTSHAARPHLILTTTPGMASEFFWLSSTTFAYLNGSTLYSTSISSKGDASSKHILDFPEGVQPNSLRYEPVSGLVGFSGMIWQDGDFENVAKFDKEYETRGDSGQVYDELYIRYVGCGSSRLISQALGYMADSGEKVDYRSCQAEQEGDRTTGTLLRLDNQEEDFL